MSWLPRRKADAAACCSSTPSQALYLFRGQSLGLAIAAVSRSLAQAMMIAVPDPVPHAVSLRRHHAAGKHVTLDAICHPDLANALLHRLRLSGIVKGNGLAYVWHDILGIVMLGSVMFGFAVVRFRRLVG